MAQVQEQEQQAQAPGQAPGQEFARVVGGAGRKVLSNAAFPDANRTALALECGVSMAHLCKIFHGQGRPSLGLAVKLAKAMGLSVEAFSKELDAVEAAHKRALKLAKAKAKKGQR